MHYFTKNSYLILNNILLTILFLFNFSISSHANFKEKAKAASKSLAHAVAKPAQKAFDTLRSQRKNRKAALKTALSIAPKQQSQEGSVLDLSESDHWKISPPLQHSCFHTPYQIEVSFIPGTDTQVTQIYSFNKQTHELEYFEKYETIV